MEHIYNELQFGQDWFTYPILYKSMVEKFPSGSIFVEVGSWKGKSSSYMAVEIANSKKDIDFYCVDHWLGSEEHHNPKSHAYEPEISNLYETFIENMKPLEGYYIPLKKTSLDASNDFDDQSVDFVFIDASHDYESVKNDIIAWTPKIKKGGILAGHDVCYPSVSKAIIELLPNFQVEISEDCWIYNILDSEQEKDYNYKEKNIKNYFRNLSFDYY